MASARPKSNRLKIEHLVVVLGLGGLIALAAIGMVWRKAVVQKLGGELKAEKVKLAILRKERDALMREYDSLGAQAALEQRVKDLRLGLALPTPEQVIKLPEPATRSMPAGTGLETPATTTRVILGEIQPGATRPASPQKGGKP